MNYYLKNSPFQALFLSLFCAVFSVGTALRQPVNGAVNDGHKYEGYERAYQQSADYHYAERLHELRTLPYPYCERNEREYGGERSHEYGAEAHFARLLHRAVVLHAAVVQLLYLFEHDYGVVHHDAHEHNEPDKRDDVERGARNYQGDKSARKREGYARHYNQRLDCRAELYRHYRVQQEERHDESYREAFKCIVEVAGYAALIERVARIFGSVED